MEPWVQTMLTIVGSVVASSGFWAFVQSRANRNDSKTKLLVGLAHDIIVSKGMQYIERGWITQEEYENLNDYIYKPYEENGGNGTAKKIMQEVNKLPMHTTNFHFKEEFSHEDV